MARLKDFELQVRSDPVKAMESRKAAEPASSLTRDHSTLEGLLYPIVILNRQGSICFMNGAARRLLAEGLDERLAAHIRHDPDMGPISQVHFKLQNGHDLILKVRRGEIEWLGEKATQLSLSNVTPYLSMIQELERDLGTQKKALAELTAHRPEVEQQLAANTEALAKLQAEREADLAARTAAQDHARGLREDLDRATQENTQLRSDLATISRVREELKESRLRLQKQIEEFQAARSQGPGAAPSEIEERARSLSAELEKTRSELELEARKSAEAEQALEAERAEHLSRAAELGASLEQARQQAEAEASQGRQAQAELEKARAAASASEQAHSKLRQELEALKRDLEQLGARGEVESSQVAELLEENERLKQDLAARAPRESEAAAALAALAEKTGTLTNELAAARQEMERAAGEARARKLEAEQLNEKLAAQAREVEALSAARSQLDEHNGAQAGELARAVEQLRAEAEAREKMSARIEKLESELSAAAAEREKLQREVAENLTGDASVRAEMEAGAARRQSLEKEIAALRQDLAAAEQARSESARTIESLKGEGQSRADALDRAREELAEAARLAKVQQNKAAKTETEVASALKAETAKRESLEKEIAALRKHLAGSEQARTESAQALKTLEEEGQGHADALARAHEKLAETAQFAKVQQDKVAKAEAEAASKVKAETVKRESLEKEIAVLRQDLSTAQQARSESARTIEKLNGEGRGHADALVRAREELAEAVRLAKVQQDKAAKAETEAAAIKKAETARRESLEKETAALRKDLARSEQDRSQSAKALTALEEEGRGHADALARAHEKLAETAKFSRVQQDKVARAEAQAASLARELERVKSESSMTIETLKAESRNHTEPLLVHAREELIEAARLAKAQEAKIAQVEAEAASFMKAESSRRQSLEKQIAALREDLAGSERVRSESARTIKTLKDEGRDHADAMVRAYRETAAAVQLAKDQQHKVARAEAEVAAITNELNRVKYEAAETIESLKGKRRLQDDARLAQAREEVAEAARAAKAHQAIAAEVEKKAVATALELQRVRAELGRRADEAETSEKAWAQERLELQRRVRELANSVEQDAKKLEDSEAIRKQSANEVTWLSKQLAEQVAAGEALRTVQQKPAEQAASLALALSNAQAELKARTDQCVQALEERKRLEAELSELHAAAGQAAAVREGRDQTAAQMAEELRILRSKLDTETQSRRLVNEKIAQLQKESMQAQEQRKRLETELSELHAAAGQAAAVREGRDQATSQAAEELRLLRSKLDAESQSRRIANEKIAQLQQEMAGYRQTVENPAVLHETEGNLARRVKELAVAEEQVCNLSEELRAVRAGNVQQDERVDKLRRLAAGLKQKCDALEAGVKTRAHEQDQLRKELHEQAAMRQAAEAEVERLRQNPGPAKPEEPESEEIDADFIADLREELQAAARTLSPNRPGPGAIKPAAPGTPVRKR